MSKVIFIIVPSCSNSEWLNDKMLQMTSAFIATLNIADYPVYTVNDYNDINQYLDQADFLVVSTAGNLIIERDHVWNKIHDIKKDIGLITYLLKFKNDITPYMHEQFFIINTKAVSSVDLSFNYKEDNGVEIMRSVEDMHEGNSPLYVNLGEKIVKRQLKFGTKLIEDCLLNGYKVQNFDKSWRYPEVENDYVKLDNYRLPSQGYCHPKKSTETFEYCLKTLTLSPELDEAQTIFITLIKKILDFNVLNVWQYDQAPKLEGYQHVLAPATGFLGELSAYNCGIRKITFYDKNVNNIEFKKDLYKYWDGKNYDEFAAAWAKQRNLAIEPSFEIDRQNAEKNINLTHQHIFKDWQDWKNSVSLEFISDDLIGSKLIMESIIDKTIIYTSTILGIYPFTAIAHSKEAIEKTKQEILQRIKATESIWIEK